MSKRNVTAAVVREWAAENNIPVKAGRLPSSLATAFNKAHKNARYVPGTVEPKVMVVKAPGKPPRRVNVTEARKALQAADQPVGARGRLTKAHALAYLALPKG